MSVLSYLTNLSSHLVHSATERADIGVSIGNPQTILRRWPHYTDIQEQAVFGSYDRETILPRKYDEGFDLDYSATILELSYVKFELVLAI